MSGKQRKETARTLDDARALKRRREPGDTNAAGRLTFAEYARDWITRHPVRDSTRSDYTAHLDRWLIPFIGEKRKLADVTQLLVNQLVGHLREAEKGRRRRAPPSRWRTPRSRRFSKPLRACLGQAVRDGLIPHNPTGDLRLPARETVDDVEAEDVRAHTAKQLATLLALMPARYRRLFRFLAATGLRISELFAIQRRHLELVGDAPHVKVRRAYVRGKLEPQKTRHGRREVPLSPTLVGELRAWRTQTDWPRDDDLVFPTMQGGPHIYGNLRHRALVTTAQEAGVPWVSFRTFRHTCASMLVDRGNNAKQVQRWLGHHSAAFALETSSTCFRTTSTPRSSCPPRRHRGQQRGNIGSPRRGWGRTAYGPRNREVEPITELSRTLPKPLVALGCSSSAAP